MDISRLTIDRENWKIKRGMYKRNKTLKKRGYGQARSRVNIGSAFQRWREFKEREGLESRLCFFLIGE